MPAEAQGLALPAQEPSVRRAGIAAPPSLTTLAGRNAIAALVDYAARLGVGLLVTPMLVRGLGPTLFGAWEMLQRLGGYVTATDGRPTESLRLVIAQSSGSADAVAKRRLVGAALVVWLLLVPLVAAVGALLIYWAPALVGTDAVAASTIRVAAALVVATALLGSLASVPESVLRGLNLGYTRIGIQSALHAVGGLLAVAAVWAGTGLRGLGTAMLAIGLLTGLCFWALVRGRVAWFGAARPQRAEVRTLLSMSAWLTVGDLIAKSLLASDVLILGAVLAPGVVTSYVLTGYAARVAVGVHVFTAGETMPGIGACLGREEYARARGARRELLAMSWLYTTVAGATILLWNRSFIGLWVGEELYAGPAVDVLLVLIAIQTAFIRLDSGVIDAGLRPRSRVGVGAAAAAITLSLGILLTARWGMVGLCIGLLAGRSVQTIAYPLIVRRVLGPSARSTTDAAALGWRAAFTAAMLGSGAVLVARSLAVAGWVSFVGGVAATIPFIAVAAWFLGLPPVLRRAIARRLPFATTRGAPR